MARYTYPTVPEVAGVLVTARPWLPWEREAPVRHAIRTMLVLQGMAWQRADWIGHSLVGRARIEAGVGQPRGWDSDADLSAWLPDYDNPCHVCGRPFARQFPEQVCCSTACATRRATIVAWSIARVGQTSPPRCKFCWQYFEPDDPKQVYCTPRCQDHAGKLDAIERADAELGRSIAAARRTAGWTQADLAARVGIHQRYLGSIEEGRAVASGALLDRIRAVLEAAPTERLCEWCGGPIPPEKDPRARFCCRQHTIDFNNAKKLKRTANGHAIATNGSAAGDRPGIAGVYPSAGIGPARNDAGAPRAAGAHPAPSSR